MKEKLKVVLDHGHQVQCSVYRSNITLSVGEVIRLSDCHGRSMFVWVAVGGSVPADTYEVALLNGCDLQDASQFIQVSQQQQQQLAILYNNNIVPIS